MSANTSVHGSVGPRLRWRALLAMTSTARLGASIRAGRRPSRTRCSSGTRSSSTRSSRRTRRIRRVSGSAQSCTPRSSTPYNGIERRYTPIFVQPRRAARRVATGRCHRCRAHGAGRPVSGQAGGAGRELHGVTRRAERRWWGRWSIARARHRVGNRSRGVGARVARERRVQRDLSGVHWRNGGRPVAPDPAGVRPDERAGPGVHGTVRRWPAALSSSLHRHEDCDQHLHGRFQRREGARPQTGSTRTDDQSALAPCSGKGTPAFTGTRRPTRSRARTTCRCRRPTGCSRC